MKSFKIKSYCKINLSLKIIEKLKNGYHNISSLITFCNLHDLIFISKLKSSQDKIYFYGKFKGGINKRSNTITEVLRLLRNEKLLKNQSFKIKIKKNIPHGSGLGGGSSNAASLLLFLNKKMKIKLSMNKMINLAKKIGSDVPVSLERKNTLLIGKNDQITRYKKKFKFDLLVVYPNLICSTKKIYKKNKKKSFNKKQFSATNKTKEQVINYLCNESNDLQDTVTKIYPDVAKIINFIKLQKGCYFSRITGSGSACIGIFSSRQHANFAQKMIKTKYPKYWSAVSKTI